MKTIKCKSHKGHNATIHCPTCFKNFELKDLIREAKVEVFDKFREILEAHRNVSMVTCSEDCFCWKIDTELMKEEISHRGG